VEGSAVRPSVAPPLKGVTESVPHLGPAALFLVFPCSSLG
jgi:hypothetical protein